MVNFEALMNREKINLNINNYLDYIKDKRVLITGAGGTIGSELSRQLLFGGAKRLYLFNHSENNIFNLLNNLKEEIEKNKLEDVKLVPIIGELQDFRYIDYIVSKLKLDAVFHAAAHKHVDLSEENPVETIKNNVFGTKNIVDACRKNIVPKLILISTDKSVKPLGIYGISKKLAEEIVLNEGIGNKQFLVVRFGNVLGSNGSVFYTFKKRIEEGKPIIVNHPEVKRFFMSIEEAVSLVLKIGGVGKGDNLYLLDMGEQILIKDLALNMMKYYNKFVDIQYGSLGRAEKIEEELFDTETELPKNTIYSKIKRVERITKIENIDKIISDLKPICYYDSWNSGVFRNLIQLRNILKPVFPLYKSLDYITES